MVQSIEVEVEVEYGGEEEEKEGASSEFRAELESQRLATALWCLVKLKSRPKLKGF